MPPRPAPSWQRSTPPMWSPCCRTKLSFRRFILLFCKDWWCMHTKKTTKTRNNISHSRFLDPKIRFGVALQLRVVFLGQLNWNNVSHFRFFDLKVRLGGALRSFLDSLSKQCLPLQIFWPEGTFRRGSSVFLGQLIKTVSPTSDLFTWRYVLEWLFSSELSFLDSFTMGGLGHALTKLYLE